jgi:hypothetical protein
MSSKLTIPTLRVFRRYILALLVMTAVFYGCAGETTSTTVEVTRVVEVEKEVKVKGDTVVETVVVEKEVKVKGDTVVETVVVEASREGMSDADYVASREASTTTVSTTVSPFTFTSFSTTTVSTTVSPFTFTSFSTSTTRVTSTVVDVVSPAQP